MHPKPSVAYLSKIAVIVLLLFAFPGCSRQTENTREPTITDDSELSDFILGDWRSTVVVWDGPNGLEADVADYYRIVFESKSQVTFIVHYPGGGSEVDTFTYYFIDQDTIFVDNKRIAGGETWILKKQESNLVVSRTVDHDTDIILLERKK